MGHDVHVYSQNVFDTSVRSNQTPYLKASSRNTECLAQPNDVNPFAMNIPCSLITWILGPFAFRLKF